MHAALTAAARIGPNAVTRFAEALGPARAQDIFARAGLSDRLANPPGRMVPEAEVTALHRVARSLLGETDAEAASREAGRLTALYLLANRIPRVLQAVLKRLPAGLAARILTDAIGRHAWTFAGSGTFRVIPGPPMRLEVAGGPIPRAGAADHPVCGYYAATFETLFRALVSPRTQVAEVACEAMGAPACVFELRW
ncbi:bacteriochlorophyll 4-vinyl reductase [Roseomonas sp. AR75]|uniref:bacteriochlorophyll 4-vinyl reductase n=1 Tax=Roseomonas sp. AR75 TaxID=2562311 RepID=UPI0010C027BD|nr:bacteriochlorophyll 4-vinyl reductase [Roseomonas sp. AR75]